MSSGRNLTRALRLVATAVLLCLAGAACTSTTQIGTTDEPETATAVPPTPATDNDENDNDEADNDEADNDDMVTGDGSNGAVTEPVEPESQPETQAEATPVPEPTLAPTPTPTPAPTATPVPNPTPDLQTVLEPALRRAGIFDPEVQGCIADVATDDPELVGLIQRASAADRLPIDDQLVLVELAIDCDPVATAQELAGNLNLPRGTALEAVTTGCFVDGLSADHPERRQRITGLLQIGNEQPASPDNVEPLVDLFTECFPTSVFTDGVAEPLLADPALAAATDLDCLDSVIDPEDLRPIWRVLAENPGVEFEQLDPATTADVFDGLLANLFTCVSFGQVLAEQFVSSFGVDLSDATIGCIDAGVAGFDAGAILNEDPALQDEMSQLLFNCLTPAERTALGG